MSAVVCPIIYSPQPSELEVASFRQCLSVLGTHQIHAVCPKSLDTSLYVSLCREYSVQPVFQRFEDSFFQSVQAYNTLMLSELFYERFADWEQMLVYQLDAWVFSDQLEQWAGYDYVGAPWFTDDRVLLPYAGNGGFSSRNPKSCLEILRGGHRRWKLRFLYAPSTVFYGRSEHFHSMLRYRLDRHAYLCNRFLMGNEDVFFVRSLTLAGYSVALPLQAAMFSFERFPEKLYAVTGQRLPFGCHAFAKYNPLFWRRWIHALPHEN